MTTKGVVPVSRNFARQAIWTDAQTFAYATSDYTRTSTLRITFAAMQLVRRRAEQFIGKPATLANRNALDTAVTSALNGMMKNGALLNADHSITFIPRESKAMIELILQPAFELRNIEIAISVDLGVTQA